jgi:ligand-binding SRPBCC domain-containing protein
MRCFEQLRRRLPLVEFSIASTLSASAETLWSHAVSPEGVNREFRPLLRMTFPPNIGDLTDSWRPGRRLFRSWLLLGGLLPVDYDDVAFAEVDPGRRFLERSSLLSARVWEHERVIEPVSRGCRLTDRVRFAPRLSWLAPLYRLVFRAVFRLRHRNLRRLFRGGSEPPPAATELE